MRDGTTKVVPGQDPLPADLSVLKLSIPVAMGYIPLGMAFGFLLAQAGGAWWLAPLMSLFIYAGAAQFMVVPMLSDT